VAFGLRRKSVAKDETDRRVKDALVLVDLPGFERRKPSQLSGGQQQRVALARALVNRPKLLLLDEPLGALDLKLRKQMQLELMRIQREVGVTFIYVTHDQEEALVMSDRIAVMSDGHVEQIGFPEDIYERPRTAFVANSLGTSNLLGGAVEGTDSVRLLDGSVVTVDTAGRSGDVAVGVRPEKIRLGDGGTNVLQGKVRESAYIGVATQIVVTTAVGDVTVFHQNSETGGLVPAPGDTIVISWRPESGFVVGQEGTHT